MFFLSFFPVDQPSSSSACPSVALVLLGKPSVLLASNSPLEPGSRCLLQRLLHRHNLPYPLLNHLHPPLLQPLQRPPRKPAIPKIALNRRLRPGNGRLGQKPIPP